MLVTFHVAVLSSLLIAADQPAGVVLHAVLALLFVISFVRRENRRELIASVRRGCARCKITYLQ